MSLEKPNESAIFNAARKIAERGERAAYLSDACQGDAALQARVERLLSVYAEESQFLEQPAAEWGATIIHPAIGEDRARSLDAGLAAAFGSEQAVVLGDGNHSVLKMLGQSNPRYELTPRFGRSKSTTFLTRSKRQTAKSPAPVEQPSFLASSQQLSRRTSRRLGWPCERSTNLSDGELRATGDGLAAQSRILRCEVAGALIVITADLHQLNFFSPLSPSVAAISPGW